MWKIMYCSFSSHTEVSRLYTKLPACKNLEDVDNCFPMWDNISSVFVYTCHILTIQTFRIT